MGVSGKQSRTEQKPSGFIRVFSCPFSHFQENQGLGGIILLILRTRKLNPQAKAMVFFEVRSKALGEKPLGKYLIDIFLYGNGDK